MSNTETFNVRNSVFERSLLISTLIKVMITLSSMEAYF